MTLVEFLLARYAEIVAKADHLHHEACATVTGDGARVPCDCGLPSFTIADIEAKRRIVELALEWEGAPNDFGQLHRVLELLALPHADHPAFQPAWQR